MKWTVLVLAACGAGDREPSTPPANSGSTRATAPAISEAVRKKVCGAEPCGGELSSITVYRDAGGAVKKLYRLYGPCSHNPGIYFDPDGTQTEIIPEKPIEPGSEEAKAFQAKHDKQVGGLTKAESIGCR